MQPDKAERLAELVEHAFELEGAERAAFLAQACGDEVELRAEVEALLGEQEHAAKLMNAPAVEIGAKLLQQDDDAGELRPGELLGEYRIASLLGEGGMGEVYLADDTHFGRQVAIKLIKQGFGTKEFVRHFRQEERILAALNHPNIARLYGGAVTPKGLPYFVMEYVEGIPLETYATQHSLNVRERLALFRKVCAAVSYAHQNLVIHRDLKPANIRVTAEGEPKLLDFGIARLLDPETAQTENQTMLTVRAMTPNYASPEQVRGERMTTASDVYSLGVVVYQLLAGQKPGVRKDGEADLKKVDADLDNIVFKSLRLEPERRYSSVGQFSEDIRRYLEGLPVIARKDTFGYRSAKFISRNKASVVAVALVLLALLGGLVTTAWQGRVARLAQVKAETSRKQAERLNQFLENLLSSADPAKLGKDVKVVQVLDAAGKNIDQDLAKEPEVLAQVHETLSRAYQRLQVLPPAEEHARKALAIFRRLHGGEDLATAQAEFHLGSVLAPIFQLKEADLLLRHALAIERRQSRPDNFALSETLRALGDVLSRDHRPEEAAPLLAEALTLMRAARGEQSVDYVQVLYSQAYAKHMETEVDALHNRKPDLDGAIAGYRRVITLLDQVSPQSTQAIIARFNLCLCLGREGKVAEAQEELDRLDREQLQILGENNLYHFIASGMRGVFDFNQGNYPKVLQEVRAPLDFFVANEAPSHRNVVQMRGLYGLALTRTGHAAEGEPFVRAAYEEGRQTERFAFGLTFGNVETALGECLTTQGKYDEAEPLLLTGYDDLHARLGEKHPMSVAAAQRLHQMYIAWHKPAEATRFAAEDYSGAVDSLQKSLAIREKSAAADPQNAQASFDLAGAHGDLADALSATGDAVQALAHARASITLVSALLASDPTNAIYSRNLATFHDKLGDIFARAGADKNAAVTDRLHSWSEARSSYQKAHEIFADLQAHGTLPPADAADQPKEFAKRMSDCQDAIKTLTAANSSP